MSQVTYILSIGFPGVILRPDLLRFERKRPNTVSVEDLVALQDSSLAAGDQADLAEMRAAGGDPQ